MDGRRPHRRRAVGQRARIAQEKLTVWWVKGFYKAEDDALFEAIKKFEAKNKGVKVELSQYPIQDMIPKTVAALDAGTPPDVAYADVYDFQVAAKWAFDGKLEDISSVIKPIKRALRAEHGRDHLPLQRQGQEAAPTTPSRSSSRPCTSSTGSTCWPRRASRRSDIPKNWKGYWTFWCDKAQPATARRPATAPSASAARWAWIRATRSTRS